MRKAKNGATSKLRKFNLMVFVINPLNVWSPAPIHLNPGLGEVDRFTKAVQKTIFYNVALNYKFLFEFMVTS